MSTCDIREGRMFPNFQYRPGMEAWSVYSQLNTKYGNRMIMEGGPLVQPQEFYALLTPKDLDMRLERELNGPLDGRLLNPMFLNHSHAIYVDEAVERILSGSLRTPIVFKPNFGALGEGIYFISENEKDDYEIVVRSPERGLELGFLGLPGVLKYIKDNLEFSDERNVFRAFIRGDDTACTQLLRDLMRYGTVKHVPFVDCLNQNRRGEFDPGLVESFIDAWKFDGLAYETRHRVEGNLAKRVVFKVADDYARIGGSRQFANQSYTRDKSMIRCIPSGEMYSPLFSALIDPSQKNRFRLHVRETLERAFLHYAERLFNEGIVFESDEPSEIEFDLIWIPPSEEGKLPTPAMTECGLRL